MTGNSESDTLWPADTSACPSVETRRQPCLGVGCAGVGACGRGWAYVSGMVRTDPEIVSEIEGRFQMDSGLHGKTGERKKRRPGRDDLRKRG